MKKLLCTLGSLATLPLATCSVSCTFHDSIKKEYVAPVISDLDIWEENIPEEQQKINIIVDAFEDDSIVINDTTLNKFNPTQTKENILKVIEEQLKDDSAHLKLYKDLLNHYSVEDAYYLFRILKGSLNPSNLNAGHVFLIPQIENWPEYQFLTKEGQEFPRRSEIFKYIVQSKVLSYEGIKDYLLKKYTPVSIKTGEALSLDYNTLLSEAIQSQDITSQDKRFSFFVFFAAAYLNNTFEIIGDNAGLWSNVSAKIGGEDTVRYILGKWDIPVKFEVIR